MSRKESEHQDPFADTDDESEGEDAGNDVQSESESEPTTSENSGGQQNTGGYPYILRRETVKSERDTTRPMLLRDEYAEMDTEVARKVAEEMGVSESKVRLTDVHEAYIELANEHPEELAEILLSWGYDAKV